MQRKRCAGFGQLPTPRELFEQLSEHVVGQEEAKRAFPLRCTTTTSA